LLIFAALVQKRMMTSSRQQWNRAAGQSDFWWLASWSIGDRWWTIEATGVIVALSNRWLSREDSDFSGVISLPLPFLETITCAFQSLSFPEIRLVAFGMTAGFQCGSVIELPFVCQNTLLSFWPNSSIFFPTDSCQSRWHLPMRNLMRQPSKRQLAPVQWIGISLAIYSIPSIPVAIILYRISFPFGWALHHD
jgi:hypothetical protein